MNKALQILIIITVISSCVMDHKTRKYKVYQYDEKGIGWDSPKSVECDSFNMINPNSMDIWVDGRKSRVYAKDRFEIQD